MSFVYKNPISSSQLTGVESVARTKTFGTNFSVLQTGGYMEVYSLNDLVFTIPSSYYTDGGIVEYTGNTIPIQLSIGPSALPFIPDTLTLNSDGISSGRRRLGMLVYVHETKLTYQYEISNFETLYNAADSAGAITSNSYGYTVSDSTTAGKNLLDAWTGSTIEGVSGTSRDDARWKIFWGTDWQITGGTFNSGTGTLSLENNTGGTLSITGFTNTNIANSDLTLDNSRVLTLDGNDLDILGGTGERLQLSSSELILSAATSGSIAIKGISSSSDTNYLVIDGNGLVSYNTSGGGAATAISGITYDNNWGITKEYTDGTSGTTILPFITGGTYTGGEINLNNALGDSISISAPETADTYVTGGTYTNATGTLELERNDGNNVSISGFLTGSTGSQNLQQVLDNGNVSNTGMYISGATFTASTVDINGGTIDNVALGSTNPVSLVSNSVDINGGTIDGVALGATNPVSLVSNSVDINGGTIDNVTLGNTNPVILISNSVDINGGTIDNVTLGNSNPVILISNSVDINGGAIDNTTIGAQVRSTGAFTYLYDNNGSTGTTGQILSTTLTGITWIDSSSTDYYVTGGTLSAQGTLTLTRNDGNNVTITGFTAQESDTYVTGATYTESTGILTLTRNDGQTVGTGGFSYIKSLTLNNNNLTITPNIGSPALAQINAITDLGYSGWGLTGTSTGVFYLGTELPFITGGTFSSGTLTLGINNGLESNIVVTGFDADDTYITGGTYNPTTLTLGNSDGVDITITGFAPEITGGTYSNGTISLNDNTGGSVDITGITFTSTNIYNTDGQLDGNRVIDQNSNSLTFSGGSVSVGTGTTSPVCAVLELASTNQGLLIPRMTQVQRLAINSPLAGLLVFCTDSDGNGQEGMYMYKSTGWVNVL